jgi:hypothetical protein
MLPLGKAANWMTVHNYMGYGVIAIFGFHTSLSFPDGAFEWALWLAFILVAFSGVLGAYLAWSVPAKLERRSEGIIFERIPAFRSELAREVESLAISSVNHSGSLTISDLYVNRLHEFFKGPQNVLSHLRNSRRPVKRICDEIDGLKKYLDKSGEETLQAIRNLVVRKDDLDFQYAHDGFLQAWLFVHIPATYALIVLTIIHVAIVYAFSSGVP